MGPQAFGGKVQEDSTVYLLPDFFSIECDWGNWKSAECTGYTVMIRDMDVKMPMYEYIDKT